MRKIIDIEYKEIEGEPRFTVQEISHVEGCCYPISYEASAENALLQLRLLLEGMEG